LKKYDCIGMFVAGLIVGMVSSYLVQADQYAKLRSEIIMKTGTDITYPNNDCVMNDTFYGGINSDSCK